MRSTCFALLLLGAAPLAAQTAPDPAALPVARSLLIAMRTAEAMDTSLSQMIASQRQAPTGMPPVFWDSLQVRFRRAMPQLLDEVATIYLRHYTKGEMEQLLVWYDTPLGRKVAAQTATITRESMVAGQTWGAAIGQQLVGEMQEKGLLQR